MNKIKKVWLENKVLFVLGMILIVCLVVIVVVALTSFYGGSEDVYGDRLDIVDKVPLGDDVLVKIKSSLEENDKVEEVSVTKKGLLIYVRVVFVPGTKMDDAKKACEVIAPNLNEEQLLVYDIDITIKASGDEAYTLKGAINASGTTGNAISWSNYNISQDEGE